MEGLVKGLLDIAIGHNERPNEDRDSNDNSESFEERSRSTWAEVVSGEQDGNNQTLNDDHHRHDQNPNQNQWSRVEDSDGGGVGGGDQGGQYRPHSRPPRNEFQESYGNDGDTWGHGYNRNRKEENDEGADDWQTVHKKHTRRQQKIHMDHWDTYKRHPSEQEYSKDVEDNAQIEPSEEELSDFSQACSKLWELDFNRLVPGKDYEIDCGEGKKVYCREDMAEGSLFTRLENNMLRKPTFSRFCALLDNYNPNQGCKENITEQDRQEQVAFIEEISRTAPIKYLYKYLSSKGFAPCAYDEFKTFLIDLWFDLHGRGGTSRCSSAFEHVFVGEIKQRGEEEVSGFHNWLQFYLEEAKGNIDYQGYILPRRRGEFEGDESFQKGCKNVQNFTFKSLLPDSQTQLLTIQFEWNGVLKSVSSTFIGVSPEFEVALYTLCFLIGGEDNRIQLGPYNVNIKCYHMGNKIGSVFPVAEN